MLHCTRVGICSQITTANCLQGGLATPLSKHLKRYMVLVTDRKRSLHADYSLYIPCNLMRFAGVCTVEIGKKMARVSLSWPNTRLRLIGIKREAQKFLQTR
ncbi:MAG: hypothetical protein FWG02_09625, partial [Holophagaceae bacterium]|nr:hypothetical protein [Holophagaceae bacterium]